MMPPVLIHFLQRKEYNVSVKKQKSQFKKKQIKIEKHGNISYSFERKKKEIRPREPKKMLSPQQEVPADRKYIP